MSPQPRQQAADSSKISDVKTLTRLVGRVSEPVSPWWSEHAPELAETCRPITTDDYELFKKSCARYRKRRQERIDWLLKHDLLAGDALRFALGMPLEERPR